MAQNKSREIQTGLVQITRFEKTRSLETSKFRQGVWQKNIEIGLIILATATPDHTFPATATQVQAALECGGGVAFDVQAVCSGFLYALATADSLLRTGMATKALVIGAETFSRILDWEDRTTCVLFGDGAGAVVLEAQDVADDGPGILASRLHADGAHKDMLYVDGGVSTTGTSGKLRMQGNPLFRQAVEKLTSTAETALASAGLGHDDINWIVPHQANIRIIAGTAKKMGVPLDRVIVTVQEHGNTSAASIPLAMAEGVAQGKIKRGDLIVSEAIGGGLAWGAVVLRW